MDGRHEACDQKAFASLVRIAPEKVPELRKLLTKIGDDINDNGIVDFSQLTCVHFMRWVILDAREDLKGRATSPQLLLSTNYDAVIGDRGALDTHLTELVAVAEEGIRRIYGLCEGFDDADDSFDVTQTVAYLKRHRVDYEAFYVGTLLRSVRQIRDEQALREELETYIDGHMAELRDGKSANDIREQLRAHIETTEFSWALDPWPPAGVPLRLRRPRLFLLLSGLAAAAVVAVLFPFFWSLLLGAAALVLGAAVAYVLVLLARERMDEAHTKPPPVGALRDLEEKEDRIVQNQMTSVAPMKPGVFRRLTIKGVFRVINLAARLWYTRGELGEIPSIHFARWILIDDNRFLLFLSNFDGSWENYLGDFIDKASSGLTAVWSNTYKFPRSTLLIHGGAENEQVFKAMVRESQVPTEVWYSAYPRLSVQNINNNTEIRKGLSSVDDGGAEEWLRRL